jgi:hypothetical protein
MEHRTFFLIGIVSFQINILLTDSLEKICFTYKSIKSPCQQSTGKKRILSFHLTQLLFFKYSLQIDSSILFLLEFYTNYLLFNSNLSYKKQNFIHDVHPIVWEHTRILCSMIIS